jgi:hypothetical protein
MLGADFSEATSKISETCGDLSLLVDFIRSKEGEISAILSNTVEVTQAAKSLRDSFDTTHYNFVQKFLMSFWKSFGATDAQMDSCFFWASLFLVVSVCLEYGINGFQNVTLIGAILGLSIIVFPKKYLDIILSRKDALLEAFQENCSWQGQSFDFSAILKIVFIFFSGRYTTESFSSFKRFANDTWGLSREITDISTFGKWLLSSIQPLLQYFGVEKKIVEVFGCAHPDTRMALWVDDVEKYIAKISQEQFYSVSNYETLTLLKVRFSALMINIKSMPEYSTVYNMMNRLYNELLRIECSFSSRGIGHSKVRQEPVCVMFSGQSGIGKTSLIRPLLANVLGQLMSDTNPEDIGANMNEYLYSRNPSQAYWDGYFGQFCTFIDEFDLVKSKLETKDNVKAELINMVNNSPYNLNMAHLENKGNTYFTSKLIMCTSNVTSTLHSADAALDYPEALARRFDFEVNLCVKKEFAVNPKGDSVEDRLTWKLDHDKAKKADMWSIHDCYLVHHFKVGSQWCTHVERPIGTRELIDKIVEKFYSKKKAMVTSLNNERKQAILGAVIGKMKEQNRLVSYDVLDELSIDELLSLRKALGHIDTDPNRGEFVKYAKVIGIELPQANVLFDMRDKVSYIEFHSSIVQSSEYFDSEDSLRCELSKIILDRLQSFYIGPPVVAKTLHEICLETRDHISLVIGQAVDRIGRSTFEFFDYLVSDPWAPIKVVLKFFVCIFVLNQLYKRYNAYATKNNFTAQVGCFGENSRNISNAVLANYYKLVLGNTNVGHGFFIKGRAFVLNRHVREEILSRDLDGKLKCVSIKDGTEFNLTTEILENVLYDDEEYVAVHCDDVRHHKDVSKFICTQSTLKQRNGINVFSYRDDYNSRIVMKGSVELTERFSSDGKIYDVPVALVTEMPGAKGDCGLPYMLADSQKNNKYFIGIHCAGINSWLSCSKSMCAVFPDSLVGEWLGQSFFDTTQTFKVVGEANPKVFLQSFTQIRRSKLYGKWGRALTRPAHLRPFLKDGELVKPLHVALAKYDAPQLIYDDSLVEACVTSAVVKSLTNSDRTELKTITFQQAIFGDPNVPYLDAIPRNTSPGYPWCTEPVPNKPGKMRFFSYDGLEVEGEHWHKLESIILDKETRMSRGEKVQFYYTGNLKDERRPIEKANSGSTRYFAGSNVEYYILFKKYFGAMASQIMSNRIFNEIAVGMNPYSEEWHTLAKYLSPNGFDAVDKIAGDFKAFDAHEARQVLKKIGDVVIEQFTDREHDVIRRELWRHVYESTHVLGDKLIEWCQSLPSGHPWTTIINCMYNMTLFRMAWVRAHDGSLCSLLDFSKKVKAIFLGDDNLLSVADTAQRIFSQNKLTEIFAELGQQYTSETKVEGDVPDFRKLTDVEFLKRTFRYENAVGRYVGPLRMETILEIPYWTKKHDSHEIMLANCERSIYELALWGKDIFVDKTREVLPFMKEVGYQPRSEDWLTWLDFVCQLDLPWGK